MPLNPVYLPKVDGLQTETSNINSDPRSLADCTDVISNREDFLEGRHGHPSAPVVTSVVGDAVDLYAYRNETNKVFVPTYKVSNVYQFKTISQTGEEIITGSTESSLQNINGIATTRTSQVNVKPTAFAHDERLLFLTDYGVYFRPYSTPGANSAIKVDFPLIRTVSITPEWKAAVGSETDLQAENKHWLVSGYQVNIKIVFEIEAKEGDKGERRLASPTSRIYEVKNFNLKNDTPTKRTSNMLVSLSNFTISHKPADCKMYVKVYRTLQFKIGEEPRTEYHLAAPEVEVTSTTVTIKDLISNDPTISNLEPLYNDTSQGGFVSTNHIPIPAKNVTQFRNYYIYSNLSTPVLTQVGLTGLPADNDALTIRLSGTNPLDTITRTIVFKTVLSSPAVNTEVLIPANASSLSNPYISDTVLDDLTFRGLRSGSPVADLKVRIKPGTAKGEVEPYGKITKAQFLNSKDQVTLLQTNNATVRVFVETAGFDINKFPQPGVVAIVDSTGIIKVLFSYNNYKRVASSLGFIDFEGAVSIGATMPASDLVGTYYMYKLDSENVSSLGIYKGSSTYFSFLPCKNGLEFAIASPAPDANGKVFLYSGGDLCINPYYLGLLTKPQGKLLDDLSLAIGDNLQNYLNTTGAVVATNIGDHEDGILTVEILDQRYEKIEFVRSNVTNPQPNPPIVPLSIYEPPIAETYTTFAISEKAISSFVISKENNPELLPFGGSASIAGPFYPPKIGDPNKAIVACAATKDSIYLLKEDCVARVFIGFGTLIPTVQSINIFDNTTFCVSSSSVQVLNDSVLFLAQNGVHAISGNNIDKISRQIETELKKAISQCRNASKLNDIRSFANSAKGLYGLYIPTGVTSYVTYVLSIQTMRWTKWSNTFNGAVTDLDGRLTTLMTDASGNYIRQDKYTNGDPRAEVDQIDDEFVLTGSRSDIGLVRTISSQTGLGTQVLRFGSKQVYYKKVTLDGTVLYPVLVQNSGTDAAIITFSSTPPAYNASSDSLIVGVNMMIEFQPFTNSNPSTLKMFSGFHTHTEESVLDLAVSFRTEARSTFSVVKTFSTSPDNRTVYRCYIPLEATRGRFLYRKLTHVRPYQICAIPAQAVVFRETGSERVNK